MQQQDPWAVVKTDPPPQSDPWAVVSSTPPTPPTNTFGSASASGSGYSIPQPTALSTIGDMLKGMGTQAAESFINPGGSAAKSGNDAIMAAIDRFQKAGTMPSTSEKIGEYASIPFEAMGMPVAQAGEALGQGQFGKGAVLAGASLLPELMHGFMGVRPEVNPTISESLKNFDPTATSYTDLFNKGWGPKSTPPIPEPIQSPIIPEQTPITPERIQSPEVYDPRQDMTSDEMAVHQGDIPSNQGDIPSEPTLTDNYKVTPVGNDKFELTDKQTGYTPGRKYTNEELVDFMTKKIGDSPTPITDEFNRSQAMKSVGSGSISSEPTSLMEAQSIAENSVPSSSRPPDIPAGVTSDIPDVHSVKLPNSLKGAQPRFNMGKDSYIPKFESDLDKALYIIAQKTPSKADAQFLKFVMDSTGMDEIEARNVGLKIKSAVKDTLKGQEPGYVKIPATYSPEIGATQNGSGLTGASAEVPTQSGVIPPPEPPSEGNLADSEPNPDGTVDAIDKPKGPNMVSNSLLAKLANLSSKATRTVLGTHIPGTGVSFHGFNIAVRNTLFGEGFNPLKTAGRAIDATHYLLRPESAQRYLDLNPEDLASAVEKGGLKVSTGDIGIDPMFKGGNFITKGINAITDPKPLFGQVIPALKLKAYKGLLEQYTKSGMDPKTAAETAGYATNNIFGGLNLERLQRNPITQQVFRAAALAPDWMESNVRLAEGISSAIKNPLNPASRVYQVGVANLLASYTVANVMNAINNDGKFMAENGVGHEFDIAVGKDANGRTRFFSPYGTAVDFFRIPLTIAHAAVSGGNLGESFNMLRSRTSEPIQFATDMITNSDYTGNPLYNKDKYGHHISLLTQGSNILDDMSDHFMPSGLTAIGQYLKDQIGGGKPTVSGEQTLANVAQLPMKYSYPKKGGK